MNTGKTPDENALRGLLLNLSLGFSICEYEDEAALISTPFFYSDDSNIEVVVEFSESGEPSVLTDDGMTLFKAAGCIQANIPRAAKNAATICSRASVGISEFGAMSTKVTTDCFNESFFRLIQAIIAVDAQA